LAGLLALLCAAFVAHDPNVAQAAAGRQQLRGHVPTVVAHLQALHRLPANHRLELAIGLPLRNREALTNLLQELYDPSSRNYRHYPTPQQFSERFGPSEQDYQQVRAFLESHGLRLTGGHRDRLLLDVNGSVADIERAFHLKLNLYRHPKAARTFYAPDAEPSLDLSVPTESISGLDDFAPPRPLGLQAIPFDAIPYSTPVATGSGPRGTFWGGDFRAAYASGVPLDGAGQTVGLVAFDGYFPSDVAAYADLAGLPRVALTNILLNGVDGQPGPNNIEVALDIDMAVAMAPGLDNVIVYEGALLNTILNRMASDTNELGQPLARQLSSSWGFGTTRDATRDNIFLRFQAQGQSFLQASSDEGARCVACPPFPPSDNPYVTVVGGTSLSTSEPEGAWLSETVWPGSGGGVSTNFSRPSWQRGLDLTCSGGSTNSRNFPDVAAVGDAVIWVIADNGRQYRLAGTSAAAPLWAGFAALANQQADLGSRPAIGFLNPAIYAIGSGPDYALAFHDITQGSNTNACCGSGQYFACPGYDLATGWGTPNGSYLISALLDPPDALRITPASGFEASGPVGGPFSPAAQSYSLTNVGGVSLTWTQVNTPPWLDVSSSGGPLVPGGPSAAVALSPNSVATGLAAGSYAATLWFTNLNDYFGQSRRFTLNVVTPPVIVSQPADLSLFEGMTATFTVGTATNALLLYQWQYSDGTTLTNLTNGGNIYGATAGTLTLSNFARANAGTYSVVVSNVAGQATSSGARLTVVDSIPVIATQPVSQTALPEQTVTLSVTAVGNQPLSYLWLRDGAFLTDGGNLSGTATSALTISNLSTEDAGAYAVIVVNDQGFVLSSDAVLTVLSVTAPCAKLTSLLSFVGGDDGANPNGVVLGPDGNLYGTTQAGGTNSLGTVFRMTTSGVLSSIWSFNDSDGANPRAALVWGEDGDLYGTTYGGGSNALGNVFKTTTNGGLLSLASFDTPDGVLPCAGLARGMNGNFYGATPVGGTASPFGMVYRVTPDGAISSLYSFGGGGDGGLPYAGLIQGPDGSLYGTTYRGGATDNGTVFRISTNGVLTTLAVLNGADGVYPYAALVIGSDGNFYGTTTSGGSSNNGTVFRMTPGGELATLWSFSGGADGAIPLAGLLAAADGALYGTTSQGGDYGVGTVFGITTNGTLLTLVQFDGYNGANPQAGLIQSADGMLYGTTRNGGDNDDGVAFALGVVAFPQIIRQPVSQDVFTGADVVFNVAAFGASPLSYEWLKDGSPLHDVGNLSGSASPTLTLSNVNLADAGIYSVRITNSLGSILSADTLLAVTSSPPIITLQPVGQTVGPGATVTFCVNAVGSLPLSFGWRKNGTNLTDGAHVSGSSTRCLTLIGVVEPDSGDYSALVSNTNGAMSSAGAPLGVIPSSAAGTRFTTLHWFTDGADGGWPNGLMQAIDGSLYGTTTFGGTAYGGTVFRMSLKGTLTTVVSFGWTNGALPAAALVQGTDGALYGTTEYGGDYEAGTVFRLVLGSSPITLHSFSGLVDGAYPYAALLQSADGNFYGSTQDGSLYEGGTIFRVTPNGQFANVHLFSGGTDGSSPVAALIQGTNGSFYGTTSNGGSNYCGNVFKLMPDGTLTNLFSFLKDTNRLNHFPVGNRPVATLVQGTDGHFYGTTKHSTLEGSPYYGTVFRIAANGAFAQLYAFDEFQPQDGWYPEASLIQGSDGNFYGTASGGGLNDLGTVFRITPAGAMTTLVSFDGFDTGAHPTSALVAATDGSFYGTTTDGGLGGHGTIFRLSFAPQIIVQPTNQIVLPGAAVVFSVSVFGSQPISYQWRLNGINLSDGTNISGSASSVLNLTDVSLADGGTYCVVITNGLGTVTSTGALLTILTQPVFQTIVHSNASVVLTWSAISGLTYQLQFKSELASTNWLNLGSPNAATGSIMTASDPSLSDTQRFYRVLLVP